MTEMIAPSRKMLVTTRDYGQDLLDYEFRMSRPELKNLKASAPPTGWGERDSDLGLRHKHAYP